MATKRSTSYGASDPSAPPNKTVKNQADFGAKSQSCVKVQLSKFPAELQRGLFVYLNGRDQDALGGINEHFAGLLVEQFGPLAALPLGAQETIVSFFQANDRRAIGSTCKRFAEASAAAVQAAIKTDGYALLKEERCPMENIPPMIRGMFGSDRKETSRFLFQLDLMDIQGIYQLTVDRYTGGLGGMAVLHINIYRKVVPTARFEDVSGDDKAQAAAMHLTEVGDHGYDGSDNLLVSFDGNSIRLSNAANELLGRAVP